MWLAIKQAARKPKAKPVVLPPDKILHGELGLQGAIHYKRLIDRFEDSPEAQRGPDETISDHYSRLKTTLDEERERYQKEHEYKSPLDVERPPEPTPEWLVQRQKEQEAASSPEVAKKPSLPSRDPGWYTSPETYSRGYGVPMMIERVPGDTLRPSHAPGYAPKSQSMNDWYKWLGDKGIFLDADGRRLQPRQRQPIDNHDIWAPFIDQWRQDYPDDAALRDLPESAGGLGKSLHQRVKDFLGRRRASATVNEYIESALLRMGGEEVIKVASRVHDTMTGDGPGGGWAYHESGSGDWYEKQIGDKIHRIVRQPDGWIHNSGPADGELDEYGDREMTGMPIMFDDLQGALMHASRGQVQVGFRPPPPHQQSLSSTLWSDER